MFKNVVYLKKKETHAQEVILYVFIAFYFY